MIVRNPDLPPKQKISYQASEYNKALITSKLKQDITRHLKGEEGGYDRCKHVLNDIRLLTE